MGNLCSKCLVYFNGDEARIFEPGKVSFTEDRNYGHVTVLSIRSRDESRKERTLQLGDSLHNCSQVFKNASESCIEPVRVDIIRVIGPSDDEDDSFLVTVAGEFEDGSGCLQGTGNEASMQDNTSSKEDAVCDATVNFKVELLKEENKTEFENNRPVDEYDVDVCQGFVCQECPSSQDETVTDEYAMISEKLVALITRLAIDEVAGFYQKYKREADDLNGPEKHRKRKQVKQDEHLHSSNSEIHDYANDIVKETIRMAEKELIDRSRNGFLKMKSGNEERKLASEPEGREQASMDTSYMGNVCKNNNNCPFMNLKYAQSFDKTMKKECDVTSCDLLQHIVSNDVDSTTSTNISTTNQIKSHTAHRPVNEIVVNDPRKGGNDISIGDNTRGEEVNINISSEYIRPYTAQYDLVRVAETFAQAFASNTIKQAISDVCNANMGLLADLNPTEKSRLQTAPESQVNTRSKQSIRAHMRPDVNTAWAEHGSGCSNIDSSGGNLSTETNNKLFKCLKETPVHSQEEETDFPGCYALGEKLSRTVIMAAIHSTGLTMHNGS